MHKQDAVASGGWPFLFRKLPGSSFKAPTYIEECAQSLVSWTTAINWIITLVSFSQSLAHCNLILNTSEFFSCQCFYFGLFFCLFVWGFLLILT